MPSARIYMRTSSFSSPRPLLSSAVLNQPGLPALSPQRELSSTNLADNFPRMQSQLQLGMLQKQYADLRSDVDGIRDGLKRQAATNAYILALRAATTTTITSAAAITPHNSSLLEPSQYPGIGT